MGDYTPDGPTRDDIVCVYALDCQPLLQHHGESVVVALAGSVGKRGVSAFHPSREEASSSTARRARMIAVTCFAIRSEALRLIPPTRPHVSKHHRCPFRRSGSRVSYRSAASERQLDYLFILGLPAPGSRTPFSRADSILVLMAASQVWPNLSRGSRNRLGIIVTAGPSYDASLVMTVSR